MSVLRSVRFRAPGILAAAAGSLAIIASAQGAQVILSEDFSSDPLAGPTPRASVIGSASRFTLSSGELTGHYESDEPTAKAVWDLGLSIDQSQSFTYSADFRINAANFYAHPNANPQIAFGLINSATTGTDRYGDAYEIVTVDYFPNITDFGGPSLGPSVIETDNGTGFFSRLRFPFGPETDMTQPFPGGQEGPLDLDTALTATVTYNAATRVLELAIADINGGVDINSVGDGGFGGPDGDIATIQQTLPANVQFSVDSFAILLWNDPYGVFSEPFDQPGLIADVAFDSFEVALVPEPGAAVVLVVGGLGVLVRRRGTRGRGA